MSPQKRTREPVGEAAGTRSTILREAERIFAEKGYSGARVAEIAENVGMDKGLIFYYFGSKQGLYDEILQEFFQHAAPLFDRFLRRRDGRSGRIDPGRFVENMNDFIEENRNPIRILFREFLDGGQMLEGMLRERILPIFHLWRTYYPRLFPDARASAREADHMLLTLSGMSLFYFLVEPLMERVWREDPLGPERLSERKTYLRRWTRSLNRG